MSSGNSNIRIFKNFCKHYRSSFAEGDHVKTFSYEMDNAICSIKIIIGKSGKKKYKLAISYINYTDQALSDYSIDIFSDCEIDQYNKCTNPKRRKECWYGYYLAKRTLCYLENKKKLNSICILKGIFNFPIVISQSKYAISWSHSDNRVIALAFPKEIMMGIDIEKININKSYMLDTIFKYHTNIQIGLCAEAKFTLLWTACEALSKALRIGFTVSLSIFEIKDIICKEKIYCIYYKNFPNFVGISYLKEEYFVTIAYPQKLIIDFCGLI